MDKDYKTYGQDKTYGPAWEIALKGYKQWWSQPSNLAMLYKF